MWFVVIPDTILLQVIFTRADGVTVIEEWEQGKQVENTVREEENEIPAQKKQQAGSCTLSCFVQSSCQVLGPVARGGQGGAAWLGAGRGGGRAGRTEAARLGQQARSRARSFLFDIYSAVN